MTSLKVLIAGKKLEIANLGLTFVLAKTVVTIAETIVNN